MNAVIECKKNSVMFNLSSFLIQYRGILKFVIPICLTLDAIHNAFTIWNLYKDRLQARGHRFLVLVLLLHHSFINLSGALHNHFWWLLSGMGEGAEGCHNVHGVSHSIPDPCALSAPGPRVLANLAVQSFPGQ